MLDAIGWREDVDLRKCSLLEPAAGDGAFLIEAAQRLIASYRQQGIEPKATELANRIRAFELYPREARKAARRLAASLQTMGLHHRTVSACVRRWVTNSDFLLTRLSPTAFTHTVGNPPYVRWAKIPPSLKRRYEDSLPRKMIGGDLFVPFLNRALEALQPAGQCGFLCSDRWRYMAFAEGFRRKWLPRLDIVSEDSMSSQESFLRRVDSYPSILIATKKSSEMAVHAPLIRTGKTLADLGYVIKVGPALGVTAAFVLEPDDHDVEAELLHPWLEASDVLEGKVRPNGRRVIAMHQPDGTLLKLDQYPLLKARLERYRTRLELRSIVRNGSEWFRTIDRIRPTDWARPKLLIPELSKVPRLAIDRSGAIPSHGVYAIFSADDDVASLYERLKDGNLADALQGVAPRVKGGYVRCYRRFLSMIILSD